MPLLGKEDLQLLKKSPRIQTRSLTDNGHHSDILDTGGSRPSAFYERPEVSPFSLRGIPYVLLNLKVP